MKITTKEIKQIIKEETAKVLEAYEMTDLSPSYGSEMTDKERMMDQWTTNATKSLFDSRASADFVDEEYIEDKKWESGEYDDRLDSDALGERKLTGAEEDKREDVAKAIEKDDPKMPMGKKMAIATAQAKKSA